MLILAGVGAAIAEEGSKPVVNDIGRFDTTISGQPITLPTGNIEVATSLYTIPPNQELAIHKHPYPRYGYVLGGELAVTNEVTKRTLTFKKGDFVIESLHQWHKGKSIGPSPLELLVIDQTPVGVKNMELQPEKQ
jgi:quercetin dioxygenase-like cupin family protein